MFIRTLAVAALASAIGVLALASTGGAAATKTLRFKDSQLAFTLDPQGAPKIGSRLILTKALYNRAAQFGKPSGARVGSAEVICTIVSSGYAQCSVTAHVPDGEIVAMGVIRLTENGLSTSRFAIVGGAGAYASSSGTVDTRDVSETHSLVTLNVRG
jgi:hypothetical protein